MAELARTEHALFLLSSIEKLRRKETISDFTIKVGGESIAVHQTILAAISDYFPAMFTSKMKESKERVVVMKDVTALSVKQSLDYVYTGRVEITNETVADLLHVAAMMQIHSLVRLCEKFLEKNISVENCFLAMSLAERFDFDTVKKTANYFAGQHSDTVVCTLGFRDLSSQEVAEYISKLSSCAKKWEAGITWAETNIEERRENVADIFKASGFNGCTFDFLYQTMWNREWVRQDETIAKLVSTGVLFVLECSKITVQNCFELLRMANIEPTMGEKLELLHNFMSANFEKISCHDDFKLLEAVHILHIFHSPESQHYTTSVKWAALIDWVKVGVKSRKDHFSELFQSLSLEGCTWDLLYEKMFSELLVQGCETSVQRVVSAMFSTMETTDVNHENWLKLLHIAHKYESQASSKAIEYIRNFIVTHFLRIIDSQDFSKLDKSDVFYVLSYKKTAHFGAARWYGVLKWIRGDISTREAELSPMVDILCLETYSFETLKDQIYSNPMVQKNTETKQKVGKALLAKFNIPDIESKELFYMLEIAKEHDNLSDVANKIRNHMVATLQEIENQKEFLKLECGELLKLLSMDELRRCDHNIVWSAIKRWIATDMSSRERYLLDVVKKMPLQLYPFDFLLNVILPVAEKHFADPEVDGVVLQPMFAKIAPSDLSEGNWHMILLLVKKHSKVSSSNNALMIVKNFLRRNLDAISSGTKFLQMEEHEVKDLLSFGVDHSEDAKCKALINWINSDRPTRKYYFRSLLKRINLPALSCEFLRNVLLPDPMVEYSIDVKDSIVDALLIKASQNSAISTTQVFQRTHSKLEKVRKLRGGVVAVPIPANPNKGIIGSHKVLRGLGTTPDSSLAWDFTY